MTFLFWNLNRKPLAPVVAAVARQHEVDVVILAECVELHGAVLTALAAALRVPFFHAGSQCDRIKIYSRFSPDNLKPVLDHDHYTVRSVRGAEARETLLVAAHLPSKLHFDAESQQSMLCELGLQIRDVEDKRGHTRTLIVGDLNADPFEAGVVGASGLHGAPTRAIAASGRRTVHGRPRRIFYNPMWSCFGDAGGKPGGTFYSAKGRPVERFWHVFDQVLVSSLLAPSLRGEPQILLEANGESLLRANGTPDHVRYSDHLPLLFSIEL